MPEFVVKIADERGRMREQVQSARSEAEVRDRFAQQGLYVQSVRARGLLSGGEMQLPRRRRIKLDEFLVFNQQFYTLFHAGLPILTILDLLRKQQRNPYFQSILQDVRTRVQAGEPLSQAFSAHPDFPRIYTTTILAGEKSGNLEEVLTRYITFQRSALTLRRKLAASLVYPALLIVMVTIMIAFLLTYVVPRFGQLYGDLHAKLPAITLFMIGFGEFAQKYFGFFAIAVVVAVIFFLRWRKTDAGAERIDRMMLGLPRLGRTWLKYQIALFSRTLATLLAGGIPLVTSLETAGGSMGSRLISKAVGRATGRVREGQALASSLSETGVFPDLPVSMIDVGESTGALRAMLHSVAEFYEEEVQTELARAMSLIEPALLIFMGIVVGTVLLSLYMPIFSLGASGVGG
jgi:type IV pilus assembly protein PilC